MASGHSFLSLTVLTLYFTGDTSQPASQPACLPASQPASQPACLPASQQACLPASQPASLPACLPVCLSCSRACLPDRLLHLSLFASTGAKTLTRTDLRVLWQSTRTERLSLCASISSSVPKACCRSFSWRARMRSMPSIVTVPLQCVVPRQQLSTSATTELCMTRSECRERGRERERDRTCVRHV